MSPLLTSTALGLVAAWPVGALAWGLGRVVDGLTADPRPRAAAWSLAYALPAGALAATVALTLAPTPTAPTAVPGPARMAVAELVDAPAAAPAWTPSPALTASLAWGVIGLATSGLLIRGARWNHGRRRLAKIRAEAAPCQDPALLEAVRHAARRLGVRAPQVRISAAVTEPLLAGARRPVILLPQALVDSADARKLALVCGHELAHLKRGDNWRIPAEEALAGLFWIAPPVGALRARMLAAREAVCDRAALADAAPEARRDYARVLVEALRLNAAPSAQSAFTGRGKNLASMRLSAILEPRDGASLGRLGVASVLGGVLVAATGAGSLALADQARKLTPPEIALVQAQAAQDAGPVTQAVATIAPVPARTALAAAPAAPMTAEPAPAAEAAPALEAAPAAPAASLSPLQTPLSPLPPKPPAPMAGLAPTSPLPPLPPAPMGRGPSPHPDPHPDPHPNPHPNPQPNPQPRVPSAAALDAVRTAAIARTQTDAAAEDRERVMTVARTKVFNRVTVTTDTSSVAVKVDGQPAVRVRVPRDLAADAIRQLKVVDAKADPKVSFAVTVRSDTNPWTK